MNDRFDRNIRFFGEAGQQLIEACSVAIVGIGGLGTHIVQQLALLGVGKLVLIDSEELDVTNLNRYVGTRAEDPIPGTPKVEIGERLAKSINPQIQIAKVYNSLVSQAAFNGVIHSDYVFGCLDREGARLILNELCAAYSRPYFDLASEIIPGDRVEYGGRIYIAWDGQGCIACSGVLDNDEAQSDLSGPEGQRNRAALYGIKPELLGKTGPSVVSINGVVASLAVTEFMVAVTEIRSPNRLTSYYGHKGIVTVSKDEPSPDCYYCKNIRGRGDEADVQRYIRDGVGKFLR